MKHVPPMIKVAKLAPPILADIQRQIGLKPGDEVLIWTEDGRIIVEKAAETS